MSDAPHTPARARWSTRSKIYLQLALLPVLLIAVEGGFRGWLALKGKSYSAAGARAELVELASPMRETIPQATEDPTTGQAVTAQGDPAYKPGQERVMLHPFYAFESVKSIASLETELFGVRHDEYRGEYKVLVIGGSVSGIFGVRGTPRLGELLEQDPRLAGRHVRFFGHGRGSFKQPQQLNLVTYLLASGCRYDAIINLDGFNEVALSNNNKWDGASPMYPSAFRWAHLAQGANFEAEDLDLLTEVWTLRRDGDALARDALQSRWMSSAIYGRAQLQKMDEIRTRWVVAQERYGKRLLERDQDFAVRGPKFEGGLDEVLTAVVESWVECSRTLQALCDARDMTYLHVLQPTLHDQGSKPLTPQEIAGDNAHQSWVEAIHKGYPLMRAAGERLKTMHVNFLDASMLFEDAQEPLYFDACHFRAPGNVMLAELIAPEFLRVMRALEKAR